MTWCCITFLDRSSQKGPYGRDILMDRALSISAIDLEVGDKGLNQRYVNLINTKIASLLPLADKGPQLVKSYSVGVHSGVRAFPLVANQFSRKS